MGSSSSRSRQPVPSRQTGALRSSASRLSLIRMRRACVKRRGQTGDVAKLSDLVGHEHQAAAATLRSLFRTKRFARLVSRAGLVILRQRIAYLSCMSCTARIIPIGHRIAYWYRAHAVAAAQALRRAIHLPSTDGPTSVPRSTVTRANQLRNAPTK
jgi:hypothetical protein